MPRTPSADHEKALQLLKAALGEFEPNRSLKRIISSNKEFGNFEWMLTIIGLEIDLRVDIPESLSDHHDQSANEFCKLVAKLPKVDAPGYTLECLGLVAQALLSLDLPTEPERPAKKARRSSGAESTDAKPPTRRKRPSPAAKAPARKTARPRKKTTASR
jgi:hypothetical protein